MLILCFNESAGNSKKGYFEFVVYHELCLGKSWELKAKFHLLRIRMSIEISVHKSVKLLLALSLYRYLRANSEFVNFKMPRRNNAQTFAVTSIFAYF